MADETKLSPIDIINQFFEQVSWEDETTICTDNGLTWLDCGDYLLVPCDWTDYNFAKPQAAFLGALHNKDCGVIIAGDPTPQEGDRIQWDCWRSGLIPCWINARQRVRANRLILQVTDGFDIVGAFVNELQQ